MDKRLAAEQLRRALQLFTATLPEAQALEIASVYPVWEENRSYAVGDIISYGTNPVGDPQLYKVVQAHASKADWLPDATPSLYDAFGLDDDGYAIWAQPSGAHDAYGVGDVVNYNGALYRSLIDGNVWSPDVYPNGWEKVENGENPGPEPEPDPGESEDTYPEWVQPSGAHDAYKTGDRVTYQGKVYESTMDGNVWAPDVAGWTEIE